MEVKKGQIFNLMDTNGRRSDVVGALQGYMSILDELMYARGMKWASAPESLAQYEFYSRAIELSPEVFRKHTPYDNLQSLIEKQPRLKRALEDSDAEWIKDNSEDMTDVLKQFDKGIEDRARHYTSNLVKLGFTDDERRRTPAGELVLYPNKIKPDKLESLLPLDGINLVYLRQLLKLRVYAADGGFWYSPFRMAIYILLRRERVSENTFLELVQGLSPYDDFTDIESYVDNYVEGDIVNGTDVEYPPEVTSSKQISDKDFRKIFNNGKSIKTIDIYWAYYQALLACKRGLSKKSIDRLLTLYESNKPALNKAFGRGKNIFDEKIGERPEPKEFAEKYGDLFLGKLNEQLYREFSLSKLLDQVREYSDTTRRIFKASGIVRFDKGFAELAYKEICELILEEGRIKQSLFGVAEEGSEDCRAIYEGTLNSYFGAVTSLREILNYDAEEVAAVRVEIQKKFPGASLEDIPLRILDKRKSEFSDFIDRNYPPERVKTILALFRDRTNDSKIKEEVCEDATVPTIYEYMVGIAWYYFSGRKIDLLESFNLTMSADFEPLVHAGGGQGDIVIHEDDKVVMLEATLMNANSQKRGEWEPVLRHSINLKIEEETANTGREVTTFFVADEFDYNTIHIWKAVSSIPLQSSVDKEKFTSNVAIMPVNTDELSLLMDKNERYDEIIKDVHKLFEHDTINFDTAWRDRFISAII